MKPVEPTPTLTATALAARWPGERASGSALPRPNSAGQVPGQSSIEAYSQSAAVLHLTIQAVEQVRTALESGQGAEQAAAATGVDIENEHAWSAPLPDNLQLSA